MNLADCYYLTRHCLIICMTLSITFYSFLSVANNVRFERLTTAHGLSQMSVNDILQDRHGFIWLATQDGLNRFDGHQFKIYQNIPDNHHSIPSNFVSSLFEDAQGRLWIATNGGLAYFDDKHQRFSRFVHDSNDVNSISGNLVMSIDQDQQGFLWEIGRAHV